MADHRITEIDNVFFYELEEMKQMMTGEWNVSDRSAIHETASERQEHCAMAAGGTRRFHLGRTAHAGNAGEFRPQPDMPPAL